MFWSFERFWDRFVFFSFWNFLAFLTIWRNLILNWGQILIILTWRFFLSICFYLHCLFPLIASFPNYFGINSKLYSLFLACLSASLSTFFNLVFLKAWLKYRVSASHFNNIIKVNVHKYDIKNSVLFFKILALSNSYRHFNVGVSNKFIKNERSSNIDEIYKNKCEMLISIFASAAKIIQSMFFIFFSFSLLSYLLLFIS